MMRHLNESSLTQVQPNLVAVPAPLRYYDPELQNALNAEPFDKESFQRASEKGKQLNAAYRRQVAALAPRVSKRTLSLFSDPKQPLFDADLFEFSFGDSLGYLVPRRRRRTQTTSVRATFCSFDGNTLHLLTYSQVAVLNVNVPPDRWFEWPLGRNRIDSLLANELTAVDAKLMQHAFLFVSGATISIRFERVKWETRRNNRR
jgi:hypothetical protein